MDEDDGRLGQKIPPPLRSLPSCRRLVLPLRRRHKLIPPLRAVSGTISMEHGLRLAAGSPLASVVIAKPRLRITAEH